MKIKLRFLEFRRQLVSGTLAQTQPQLALVVSWGLNFLLGMVLSAVPLLDHCGPFGIAIAAQANAGLAGLMCALGASLGYLALYELETSLKYVAAVILVYTAGYVLQDVRTCRRTWFMPSIAAFFTLLTGLLNYYTLGQEQAQLMPVFSEAILAFGGVYFFREALDQSERMTESAELRHGVSLAVFLACILMALSRAQLFETLSLGRVFAVLLVQMIAYRGGALSGVAAGIVLGTAMDISTGAPFFYAMAYAISALVSGVFTKHGKLLFSISYILCGALAVILNSTAGLHIELLYENFVSTVIFMVLPGRIINQVGAILGGSQFTTGETGLRRYTARRLRRMSEAFEDLYATVDETLRGGHNDENISQVFDRASDTVCRQCKNKSLCWNSNYMDTLSAFNDASTLIRSRGSLRKEDIPKHFLDQCLRPDELVSAINGELRGITYRRQFQARLAENRTAAYQQYLDIAGILAGVSKELENAYGPDALAQRRLMRYLNSLDLDADASVFRDRSGRLHILLESVKLRHLLREPGYLDRLSDAVGVRLCRPNSSDDNAEGRITLMEAEPLTVSVGVASMKKTGESVSGDRGTYFKTEQGTLCILLSDGMGSGESAAKESVAAVRILERFLRTGVDPALAMKMLNSVMLLKNVEEWGFATIDLLCVDLFTGEAVFYKYGAAPSYIKSGTQIRRVRSESLAAGLSVGPSHTPDTVKLRLRPGNIALIASDGVIAETNDSWVRRLLNECGEMDMKSLAREMLQTALKLYGSSDDMTVLAVQIEKRR